MDLFYNETGRLQLVGSSPDLVPENVTVQRELPGEADAPRASAGDAEGASAPGQKYVSSDKVMR